jgi:hypothetical protein
MWVGDEGALRPATGPREKVRFHSQAVKQPAYDISESRNSEACLTNDS